MNTKNKLRVYFSDGFVPYRNQAIEKRLLDCADDSNPVLYLWQNEKTVVIGKNQNSNAECRIAILENDGGHLARRISGGGAVYHDRSNLNFTFIAANRIYSVSEQTAIIVDAVRSLGIDAAISGRNDIEAGGRKFSGNAFYKTNNHSMHHGTILIETDTAAMSKYLTVNPKKLDTKGVGSVRSRVVNLSELNSAINCDNVMQAIIDSAVKHYGFTAEFPALFELDSESIAKLTEKFQSYDWRIGHDPKFNIELEKSLSFGLLNLRLDVSEGVIKKCNAFSDCLDYELPRQISDLLLGKKYSQAELEKALILSGLDCKYELIQMIKEQL